jgi:hypothetical protein
MRGQTYEGSSPLAGSDTVMSYRVRITNGSAV